MGIPVWITDPAVAAAYHAHPGEWVTIDDPDEAAFLLTNRHAWSIRSLQPVPVAGYVHRGAPAPFVPYAPPAPAPKAPPKR